MNPANATTPHPSAESPVNVADEGGAAQLTSIPATMRAAAHPRYGDSEVLEVLERPTPAPGPGEVLVAVEAVALNPLDLHMMTGTPYLVRGQAGLRTPKAPVTGNDLAGRVVAVGEEVNGFQPGDEVLGVAPQACAAYVAAPANRLALKPANVGFQQAAGMGVAAVTALQGLRDKGELQAGQQLLINGASGGVGTAAVQLAKWMGAEVTAVCSTRNVELVESLGADHVVDYTTHDFTEATGRYDVFLDNQANRTIAESRRVLTDTGTYVLVGGPKTNKLLGPIGRMIRTLIRFGFASQQARPFMADVGQDDLVLLAGLMASGELRTVIDSVYPIDDIGAAMDHVAGGHARGKIVVDVS